MKKIEAIPGKYGPGISFAAVVLCIMFSIACFLEGNIKGGFFQIAIVALNVLAIIFVWR